MLKFAFAICTLFASVVCYGQGRPTASSNFEITGTLRSLNGNQVIIKPEKGDVVRCLIQRPEDRALQLNGGKSVVNYPSTVKVTGTLPIKDLERGCTVQLSTKLNKLGQTEEAIDIVPVIDDVPDSECIAKGTTPLTKDTYETCMLTGRVTAVSRSRVSLQITANDFLRRKKVTLKLNDDAKFQLTSRDMKHIKPGCQVTASGQQLKSGERLIKKLKVELTSELSKIKREVTFEEQLEKKYAKLSNEPSEEIREKRSRNFTLYTDISDRSAAILLEKLERMHSLLGNYYGARPKRAIECYVAHDAEKFAQRVPEMGLKQMATGVGVTINQTRGSAQKTTVYSCADHGVVQHESVHAYCYLTFGDTGPTWYAEGMAEMGQYWKPEEKAVDINLMVINYLLNAKKKKLSAIVAPGQTTGDSWQAYAWRWALCYLLASNPNYERNFKKLGIAMMRNQKGADFQAAYGKVKNEISFEYDQFVTNFGNGYRGDLCAWDWRVTPKRISKSRKIRETIKAQAGWQPTKIQTAPSTTYLFETEGEWTTAENADPVDANGNSTAEGRLIGAILTQAADGEYSLSEPFDLGTNGRFVANVEGHLYLRCNESWTAIQDNEGSISVSIGLSPKKK